MAALDQAALSDSDLSFLRRAIAQSEQALIDGERPFGAVIVGPDGTVLVETHGQSNAERDLTAHAELTAVRRLGARYSRDYLAQCTLYSSTEPCAMCAGAIYWANIGRLVYGIGEHKLRDIRNHTQNTALTMAAKAVLDTGGHATQVIGPVLEDEACAPHLRYWLAGGV